MHEYVFLCRHVFVLDIHRTRTIVTMSAMGSSSTFSTDPINQDAVVFENVADQYIKGEDVHIEFTILNQQKINVKADRIGLIRVI